MVQLALVVLISFLVAFPVARTWADKAGQLDDWRGSLGLGSEKVSKLNFYFHDILSGKTPTAIRVAQSANTDKSPTVFGMLMMADDPLTIGPEPNSTVIGHAQGMYGSAGQQELGLLMVMDYSFTQGKYKGSSISILGINRAMNPVRELPIIGGTGMFRLARGMALAKTHWFNATTGDAIVEYNVTVVHY
ncbi:dirigent protein 23-like [Magnolia sinica]|uniref:dirigent protein 23-like n=1 Tax=Magnolia sinica TaxID=86752 RepID=UPI0026591C8E|nr:dirigent protein 23-like [Magnolia sinica]